MYELGVMLVEVDLSTRMAQRHAPPSPKMGRVFVFPRTGAVGPNGLTHWGGWYLT